MSKTYFDKNGQLQYVASDETEKCFKDDQVCDSSRGSMACRTNWWYNGYWNNWWGWGYNWSAYGDNLTFLYSEIDAPDSLKCNGYNPNCSNFSGQYCDDVAASSCGKPRIARCKTFGCVSDYNDNNYCVLINNKDREERCCKAPSNFECKEGECDYDYEIVKKEYTVEWELVTPSYACIEKPVYPDSSCTTYIPIYDTTCTRSKTDCSTEPKAKCDSGYYWWSNAKCPDYPNDMPEEYSVRTSAATSIENLWELDDCECGRNDSGYYTCPSCYKCEDLEDCNYDLRSWNSGWYWGAYSYAGYIGDDCCTNNFWGSWWGYYGIYNQPCPVNGDGSENPWWCDGSECSQKAVGDQSETDTGPYSGYKACMEDCLKDETGTTNKCIPDSKNYSRGYCCDSNFIDTMQDAINSQCAEEGPNYNKTTKEKLCDASSCGNDLIYERSDDMCTYSTKYCSTHKITRIFSNSIYGYDAPVQDKQYWRICNNCDKAGNDECEQDPNSKCPSNTEAINIVRQTKFVAEKVSEPYPVKLIMVFCKITAKECVVITE